MYADICRWEGCERHLYKDSHGLETTGTGFLVATVSAALALPWKMPDGSSATENQISEQYAAVQAAPAGHSAGFYLPLTTMRLDLADVENIAEERLQDEFLPALRRHFPHFDAYPTGWQRALVDVAWNVGANGIGSFHKLIIACEEGDGVNAGREAHTRETRADGSISQHARDRNAWRASMFEAKYVA